MKADHHIADLSIDPALVEEILVRFIRNEVTRTGFARGVFGLSGGIDSSTVAYLAVKALGAENVLAVTMPTQIVTLLENAVAAPGGVSPATLSRSGTLPVFETTAVPRTDEPG